MRGLKLNVLKIFSEVFFLNCNTYIKEEESNVHRENIDHRNVIKIVRTK